MFWGQQETLAVTGVATIIPVPLNSLIVTPKDHVTSLSQMAGKKVGITGIPSDGAIYQTMVKAAGLTPAKVPTETVGFNLATPLLSREQDPLLHRQPDPTPPRRPHQAPPERHSISGAA